MISYGGVDKSSGLAVVVVGEFRSKEQALLEEDMAKLSANRRALVQASILIAGIAFQATGCGEVRYRDAIVGDSSIQRIIVKGDVGVIEIVPSNHARVDFAVRAPEGAALIQHHEYDGILEVRSSCRTPILCAVDAEVHVPAGVPVQVELDRGEVWSTGVDVLDISVGEGRALRELTGCKKPCKYRKYEVIGEKQPTSFQSDHFTISFWAVSNETTVWTEVPVYPWTSLVAEFGGTLSLFLGFSFMTLWQEIKGCFCSV